jgi:hypothetical protein
MKTTIIKKLVLPTIFVVILVTAFISPAKSVKVNINMTLLSKATSSAPNGNFSHQLVTNDLDEDKCYWMNITGAIPTNCNDPMPTNSDVIALIEQGGLAENYTIWIDKTYSDNTFCDLYVIDENQARRQVPIGAENNITICNECTKNFSIYGFVAFKNLANAKNDECNIDLETSP